MLPIRSCSAPVRVVVNVVLTSTDLRDQVQQAIYNNLKGRTVLIIAHRLSTVERADRIIVISSGAVLEQGTHAELIRRAGGVYAKLVERQMLGFDVGISDEPVACDLPRSTESNAAESDRRRSSPATSVPQRLSLSRRCSDVTVESDGSVHELNVGSLKRDPTM